MRMSCNGCRVLRKGCSENCSLRPCLQWIKSPDSQANATVFLAKFYGRAGLVNLINAGPHHLRPAIFRSLLYEACGRIINPVNGSVGLMCSGNWQRCQEAVESVLKGCSTIMHVPINNDDDNDNNNNNDNNHQIVPLKSCDIRHITKNNNNNSCNLVNKTRHRQFKRKAANYSDSAETEDQYLMMMNDEPPLKFSITGWNQFDHEMEEEMMKRATSYDSFSVETVEPSLMVNRVEPVKLEEDNNNNNNNNNGDVGLELTLGLMSPA